MIATMKRREFITLLGSAAAWPLAARAQQQAAKTHRIAIVHPSVSISEMNETGDHPYYPALFKELRRLGYVEGKNLIVARYSGEGREDRYPELCRDVVGTKPDVIVTSASRLVLSFKAATHTIPIVASMADPVPYGIVTSIARPGGNITGVSVEAGLEIWGKRLQVLREAVPAASKVGFLGSRQIWDLPGQVAATREAAAQVGITEGGKGPRDHNSDLAACSRRRGDRMSSRREFITVLGGAAAMWPLAAGAQVSQKRPLIAWLGGATRASSLGVMDAFRQGMRELGYVEGGNFDMVYRYADGYAERLPALAQELVRLKPDVILAPATGQAVAAKKATGTIPIVTPALADAVHLGLIASDARPGGNVTGLTPYVAGLPAKQMELAREIVPGARRIGVLNDINDPKAPPQWEELQGAGRLLEVSVTAGEVRAPDDLVNAIQALRDQQPDAVIVLQTSMLLSERQKIAALAAAMRLPMIYGYREHVVDVGLISYGVDLRDCFRRSAVYVDKILKGTAPGDLPVEFPTKLELVINLKAAKALGLEMPPTLLARADEVIE